MELRDYIKIGSEKAGSLTALGIYLGHGQGNMSHFKSGRTPLPIEDCVKLADYIDADRFDVIAAAKFASAKNEEKKNYWMQFVKSANAAIMIVALSVITFVTSPEKAFANNTLQQQTLHFINYTKFQKTLSRFFISAHDQVCAALCVIHVATVTFPANVPALGFLRYKT